MCSILLYFYMRWQHWSFCVTLHQGTLPSHPSSLIMMQERVITNQDADLTSLDAPNIALSDRPRLSASDAKMAL